MMDKIESDAQTAIKLVERGAVPVDTIRAYGGFFAPDSETPGKELLAMAFCAAAALEFAELNEESQYKIKDSAGRSIKDALDVIVRSLSKPNPNDALAEVDNRAENKQKFGRHALKYFFAARILKKNFSPVTDTNNLYKQLESFVFTSGDRVTGNLQLGGLAIDEAQENILEFVSRVRKIHESMQGNSGGEVK